MESVLRCALCNKPFDKQSTLKRHGYYCRSRRTRGSTKQRSCHNCVVRKACCDQTRPRCSRCTSKGIECNFSIVATEEEKLGHRHGRGRNMLQNQRDAPIVDISTGSTQISQAQVTTEEIEALFAISDTIDHTEQSSEARTFSWTDTMPETWDLMKESGNNDMMLQPFSASVSMLNHPAEDEPPPFASLSRWELPFPDYIPAAPNFAIRTLVQRSEQRPDARRLKNLIFYTLRSYPFMIRRHKTLPPFIHSSITCLDHQEYNNEALKNCISLLHMIDGKASISKNLFWKMVRVECERLLEEHIGLSQWELLGAMQSLSIYILVRLDEGETEYNNADALLVKTVTVVAQQLACNNAVHNHPLQPNASLKDKWRRWLLTESARRLCVIYQVVNMVVYFEPAVMCDLHHGDLILGPLPSGKVPWEAEDELAWQKMLVQPEILYGLTKSGDLVRMIEDQGYNKGAEVSQKFSHETGMPRRIAKWEEWCAGMDGLGGLVMLAASLVGN